MAYQLRGMTEDDVEIELHRILSRMGDVYDQAVADKDVSAATVEDIDTAGQAIDRAVERLRRREFYSLLDDLEVDGQERWAEGLPEDRTDR